MTTPRIFCEQRLGPGAQFSLDDAAAQHVGRALRLRVGDAIERLQIDTRAQAQVRRLSGGNQQKVTIGRWITGGVRTFLFFDPTRGIDIRTKREIYQLVRDLAAAGGAVLLYTSELGEIQAAWSNEDMDRLRQLATPEMASYFAKDLEENRANNDINKVSNVKLLQGDLAEAWREGETDYATVAMRFSLVDKTLERGTNRLVAGSETPIEVTEVWTFVRRPGTIPAGTKVATIAGAIDLLPTLAEMCGNGIRVMAKYLIENNILYIIYYFNLIYLYHLF